MIDIPYLIALALLFALVGAAIGARRGRSGAGFFFGGLLGPLGWLLIAVGPNHAAANFSPEKKPAAPTDTLLELKKLLDAGAITQADYDAKKESVLARL